MTDKIKKKRKLLDLVKNRKIKEKKKKIHNQRPPCHFIIYGKHLVYFRLLKHFLDTPFVKTVRCIGF